MKDNCVQLPVTLKFQVNDPVQWRTNVEMTEASNITLSQWYAGRVTRSTGLTTNVDITDNKGNIKTVFVGYSCYESGMAEAESLVDAAVMSTRKWEYINGLMAEESERHRAAMKVLTDQLLSISH
jgi:hypothetical protein